MIKQSKNLSPLTALSPLDGRYRDKLHPLSAIFSEYGLIQHRLFIEIEWLKALANEPKIAEIKPLSASQKQKIDAIVKNFDLKAAERIKKIEEKTRHDVKAIEYYLREKFEAIPQLRPYIPFLHFAATSEDINNLAYGMMLQEARKSVLIPAIKKILKELNNFAKSYCDLPMLSRTHGQPATPTTLGKEFANFAYRLQRELASLEKLPVSGKFNGAVGNFNVHIAVYPKINWQKLSDKFIASLGLEPHPFTTQIEPHDRLAELLQIIVRINTILLDLSKDMWGYISFNYFKQKKIKGSVGSSTMPHKINPIDFENAEGNFGLANAIAQHCVIKLPISRFQRDLSDSTVLRNLGVLFGHALLGYQSLSKGLSKLSVNKEVIENDLNQHWEVLAEPIQTMMRRYGILDAYEQLKKLSMGERLNQAKLHQFIDQLDIPLEAKKTLKKLTPANYIGKATKLARG